MTARLPSISLALCASATCAGCVQRTISISSEPAGALVTLNGREVGRTPVSVEFLYYGVYDVVLEREGFEPLLTSGKADPPLWDHVPVDLAAELVPGRPRVDVRWHYQLQPRNDDRQALLERARGLRRHIIQPSDAASSAP